MSISVFAVTVAVFGIAINILALLYELSGIWELTYCK